MGFIHKAIAELIRVAVPFPVYVAQRAREEYDEIPEIVYAR